MRAKVSEADVAIGLRLRERRKLLGFTPQNLAHMLMISTQQLNKYEKGENRIPITQLAKICKILNIQADYLLNGGSILFAPNPNTSTQEETVLLASGAFQQKRPQVKQQNDFHQTQLSNAFRAAELANQPETKNLVKGYIAIPDPRIRTALLELVTSITKFTTKRLLS
jgi:transcriptional regulator with XRE-family HTH domain